MNFNARAVIALLAVLAALGYSSSESTAGALERLRYNNPGLTGDLGVGLWAWPLPMDYDRDGDNDLIVSCPDKPYNGTYFFENTTGDVAMPVFKAGVRIGKGVDNIQVFHDGDAPRVLVPGHELLEFRDQQFERPLDLTAPTEVHKTEGRIREQPWTYVDFDDDGLLDLIVGIDDWTDYGWDDAFDSEGHWTRGPLRGFVYLVRNEGTRDAPTWAAPVKVQAGGKPVEVFGWPTPNFADFDHDGDLDLLCGEFLDRFTYYENVGTRDAPEYVEGRFLEADGALLRMQLEMIVPAAIDWDKDGDVDLIVGDEDGRVAFVENSGQVVDRLPRFLQPRYFQQEADHVKFGALVTPVSFDWDGDGDEDLICGNTAGHIGFIENLAGGPKPKWAAPVKLEADGEIIRIQAGVNGSIQGPCEAKWGYTTLSVADWNHDELPDIVINSIWGEVLWYENIGTRAAPKLVAARPLEVEWPGAAPKPEWTWWNPKGKQLVTQWRTTPVVVDWNEDGLNDLVMLDHEGYLTLLERTRENGELLLQPPKRIFVDAAGNPLRLNDRRAGGSGRRKLCIVDWDGDRRRDLLANSLNVDLWRNVATRDDGTVVLENLGLMSESPLGGHSSSPTTVDWDGNGIRDLLVGAEDGHVYYMQNPRAE